MKVGNSMNFKDSMKDKVENIENVIRSFLPEETGFQKTIFEAMNYSVLAGGKRLRPLLMEECCIFHGSHRNDPHLFSGP